MSALDGYSLIGTHRYSDPEFDLEHDCGWSRELGGFTVLSEVVEAARLHLNDAHGTEESGSAEADSV